MVIVLWTPVVVPLLPTLVQSWAAHNSPKYAELACIIGLYSSIMILVVLWGKRIRGYEDPLERYGLELASARQVLLLICKSNLHNYTSYLSYIVLADLQHVMACFHVPLK